MSWKFNSQVPVSLQIVGKLRSDIIIGKYKPGEQFPSVRQLAYEASVNPNTMQKALGLLEAEGLLISKGTIGRFVTSDLAVIEQTINEIRRAYMSDMIRQAFEIGITKEEFINFIRESEENI